MDIFTALDRLCLAALSFGWTGPCLSFARLDMNRNVLLLKDPPELVRKHQVQVATGVAD